MNLAELLKPAVATPGVLGALIVSREDGLVVAGSLAPSARGPAVAALAARLAGRGRTLMEALGQPEPSVLEMYGTEGTLLAAPAGSELLLVAVTRRGADPLPARQELIRLAAEVR